MSQRLLLTVGVLAIAASVLIGAIGVAASPARFSTMGLFQAPPARAISMERAQSVQSFLDRTGDKDLRLDELMEFDRNFYALVKERSTGTGAFELLVDRTTGVVGFEPGPDMIGNARYGMMGGGRHMAFGPPTGR